MATIVIREEVRNPEYLTHGPWNNWRCGLADCPCAEQFWIDLGMASEQDYAELEQSGTHPPDCACSWCVPDEPRYYSRADQAADEAIADYNDELARRQETQQCSDGSWW